MMGREERRCLTLRGHGCCGTRPTSFQGCNSPGPSQSYINKHPMAVVRAGHLEFGLIAEARLRVAEGR